MGSKKDNTIEVTVISIALKAPILFPKSPERIVPIKGNMIINKYIYKKNKIF